MTMLTIRDVAERLGISPSTAYALVESHRLPHHRIGVGRGVIRVSEAQLTAYLDTTKQEREAPRPAVPKPSRPRLRHITLR